MVNAQVQTCHLEPKNANDILYIQRFKIKYLKLSLPQSCYAIACPRAKLWKQWAKIEFGPYSLGVGMQGLLADGTALVFNKHFTFVMSKITG